MQLHDYMTVNRLIAGNDSLSWSHFRFLIANLATSNKPGEPLGDLTYLHPRCTQNRQGCACKSAGGGGCKNGSARGEGSGDGKQVR